VKKKKKIYISNSNTNFLKNYIHCFYNIKKIKSKKELKKVFSIIEALKKRQEKNKNFTKQEQLKIKKSKNKIKYRNAFVKYIKKIKKSILLKHILFLNYKIQKKNKISLFKTKKEINFYNKLYKKKKNIYNKLLSIYIYRKLNVKYKSVYNLIKKKKRIMLFIKKNKNKKKNKKY